MTKFIKFTSIALIIVSIPFIGLCVENKNINNQLKKEAIELNKTLPKMISDEMQLLKTYVKNNNEMILEVKSIKYILSELNLKNFESTLKKQNISSICSKIDSVKLMKMGVKFTYIYFDKLDDYIGQYSIEYSDCERDITSNNQNKFSNAKIISELPNIANKMSYNLPVMIDEISRMDSVTAKGKTLIITYTLVTYSQNEVNRKMKSFLKENAKKGYCNATGDSAFYRENDIQLKLQYLDKYGKEVTFVLINSIDCK